MKPGWLPLVVLGLAGCADKAAPARVTLEPGLADAGAAAPQPVPFQSKPTPEWNVDFFAVDLVAMVVRLRHVEVVSVGPVRDEDVLPGLDAGTIPDTTRTAFSDGSSYTVSFHKVAKRAYLASLELEGDRTIEQADENLDGIRDSVSELWDDGAELSWRSTRPGGRYDKLTTQEVIERDGDRILYRVSRWTDADGDGRWTLEKTFKMSNVSH